MQLDGVAASVAAVRAFVRQTLTGWRADAYEWAATTVASELATNAVLHAGTGYAVALALEAGTLTIEVSDGNPLEPVRRRYGTDATTGRGLAMIATVCASWHVERTPTGKVVHCVIAQSFDGRGDEDGTQDSEASLLERFVDDEGDVAGAWNQAAA